jgi:N-acyl-D-amino-acid deacylase
MELVREARAEGRDVQCDMIPYTIGPGRLTTILPTWATQGTIEEVQARLRDPEIREQLRAQSDRYWFLFYYREWDKLTLSGNRSHPEWTGMTFGEIGEATGRDPFDCAYDIMADEGEGMHAIQINGVLFSEGDITEWLADPLFSIAADGFVSKDKGHLRRVANHPNCFGWTPRVIQKYVRELRLMSLEEAVRKMTSMPAARFGLTDRGVLRANMQADVIVFDENDFQTRATYLNPYVYAEGMDYTIVNGQLALERGVPTGTLAGRVLGH